MAKTPAQIHDEKYPQPPVVATPYPPDAATGDDGSSGSGAPHRMTSADIYLSGDGTTPMDYSSANLIKFAGDGYDHADMTLALTISESNFDPATGLCVVHLSDWGGKVKIQGDNINIASLTFTAKTSSKHVAVFAAQNEGFIFALPISVTEL